MNTKKNILIDIGHPAHVHLFRNLYKELRADGHEVYVTVKQIPSAISLLELYDIPYVCFGEKKDGKIIRSLEQFSYNYNIWKFVREHKITIGIGSSVAVAQVSKMPFSGMKSILMDDDDDEVEPMIVKWVHPFCDVVLTPIGVERKTKNVIFYPSGHDMAFLYPGRFCPDETVLDDIGVKKGEAYFLMRFNSFKAHHDIGINGLSIEVKRDLIHKLSKRGKVFITTEREIDEEFRPYQLKVSPEKIHSLMYYATLQIGDSQSMTKEACAMGTPAVRCNSFVGRLTYNGEYEEKYHLAKGFRPEQEKEMLATVDEWLNMPDLKDRMRKRSQEMLKDKIDTTEFLRWFVEEYPQSANLCRAREVNWNRWKK